MPKPSMPLTSFRPSASTRRANGAANQSSWNCGKRPSRQHSLDS
nr:MAG TPA: hypothetical protein [Caudoviricetes sp.]